MRECRDGRGKRRKIRRTCRTGSRLPWASSPGGERERKWRLERREEIMVKNKNGAGSEANRNLRPMVLIAVGELGKPMYSRPA